MQNIDTSNLKGVLFDLGGTLIYIDNDPNFYSRFIFERFEKLLGADISRMTYEEFTKFAIAYWHKIKDDYFSRGEDFNLDEFSFGLLREYGLTEESGRRIAPEYSKAIFECEYNNTAIFDGALELLSHLRDNDYRIGLISNSAYNEAQIRKLMRKVGIEDYFEIVLTSSDERCSKPNPKIFQKALSRLNLKPDEALYIGDRPRFDAEGPKNVGMQWFIVGGDVNLKSVLEILE